MNVDPYYPDPTAIWLRQRVEASGITVLIEPAMHQRGAVSRDTATIWIRPGLQPDQFHRVLSRCWLYVMRGAEAVPELAPVDNWPDARVIPLRPAAGTVRGPR